ncbi:MAG: right-handed parallel beta-helix repeat-containing protein [Thermoleophilia bacterium]|nr:right-handed parallel beta-helix repeat-containing protein [Thermoleophilia bacterium]
MKNQAGTIRSRFYILLILLFVLPATGAAIFFSGFFPPGVSGPDGGLSEDNGGDVSDQILIRNVRQIRGDATGGDCGAAGVWDARSRTCTLTGDSLDFFEIDDDGITLDGAGYTISGQGPPPAGVSDEPSRAVLVENKKNVTVRNLKVRNFEYGVKLIGSDHAVIKEIESVNTGMAAISLSNSSNNVVTGNRLTNYGYDTGICLGVTSDRNVVAGNILSGFQRGIAVHEASGGNSLLKNTVLEASWAVSMWNASGGNRVEGNLFADSDYALYVRSFSNSNSITGNTFIQNRVAVRISYSRDNELLDNSFIDNVQNVTEE